MLMVGSMLPCFEKGLEAAKSRRSDQSGEENYRQEIKNVRGIDDRGSGHRLAPSAAWLRSASTMPALGLPDYTHARGIRTLAVHHECGQQAAVARHFPIEFGQTTCAFVLGISHASVTPNVIRHYQRTRVC